MDGGTDMKAKAPAGGDGKGGWGGLGEGFSHPLFVPCKLLG